MGTVITLIPKVYMMKFIFVLVAVVAAAPQDKKPDARFGPGFGGLPGHNNAGVLPGQPGFGQRPGFGQQVFGGQQGFGGQPGFGGQQGGFGQQVGFGQQGGFGQAGVGGTTGANNPALQFNCAATASQGQFGIESTCKNFCKAPQQYWGGKYVCCDERPGAVCPPVRASCPRFGPTYQPPTCCFVDSQCERPADKCCFDQCLKHKVCKPTIPLGGK